MGAELPGAIANRGLMNCWTGKGFSTQYHVHCFCFSTADEFKPIADPLNFTHIGQQQTFQIFQISFFSEKRKKKPRRFDAFGHFGRKSERYDLNLDNIF